MSMTRQETTRIRGCIVGPTWGGFAGQLELEDVHVSDSVELNAPALAASLAGLLKRRGGDFSTPRFHPSTEVIHETSRKTMRDGSWECVSNTRGFRLGDLAIRHPVLAGLVATV